MKRLLLVVFAALFLLSCTSYSTPSVAENKRVEVYVTSWCPYCKALEAFLKARDIPYTRYDIEHSSEGIKRYQAMGISGIPIIVIDGQVTKGFDPRTLSQLLEPEFSSRPSRSDSL